MGEPGRTQAHAHGDQPGLGQRRHRGAAQQLGNHGGLGGSQRRTVRVDARQVRGGIGGGRRAPAGHPAAHGGEGAQQGTGLRGLGGGAGNRAEQLGAVPQRQPVGDAAQQRLGTQQGVLRAVPELLAVRLRLRVDDLLVLDHVGRHRRDIERHGGVVAAGGDRRRPERAEHAGGDDRGDEPAAQVDQAQPVGPLPQDRAGGRGQRGVGERSRTRVRRARRRPVRFWRHHHVKRRARRCSRRQKPDAASRNEPIRTSACRRARCRPGGARSPAPRGCGECRKARRPVRRTSVRGGCARARRRA